MSSIFLLGKSYLDSRKLAKYTTKKIVTVHTGDTIKKTLGNLVVAYEMHKSLGKIYVIAEEKHVHALLLFMQKIANEKLAKVILVYPSLALEEKEQAFVLEESHLSHNYGKENMLVIDSKGNRVVKDFVEYNKALYLEFKKGVSKEVKKEKIALVASKYFE